MEMRQLLEKETPLKTEEPGYQVEVNNIPTFITEEHNEVLFYWQAMKNSSVLHIDAHSDMGSGCPIIPKGESRHDKVAYVNYICDAIHTSVTSSVYWYNPHSNQLLDFGTTKKKWRRPSLEVAITDGFLGGLELGWKLKNGQVVNVGTLERYQGQDTSFRKMKSSDPFILDIDLDAFSCIDGKMKAIPGHNPEENYQERLDQTVQYLAQIQKPNLITITRSQAPMMEDTYTPTHQVDEIQSTLISKLQEIYK